MIGRCGIAVAATDVKHKLEQPPDKRTYFRPEGIFLALFVLLKDNLQNLFICEPSRLNMAYKRLFMIKLVNHALP